MALRRGDVVRLLVSDEVGLGKTIAAGVIVRELHGCGRAARVLILTPAGLREQWQNELSTRFSLESVAVDAAALTSRCRDLPEGMNPWAPAGVYLASIDFIKQPVMLHGLMGLSWDLLVIDEAHALAEGTARAAAAHQIGLRSQVVVLLTATPHNGVASAFQTLLNIGRHRGEAGAPGFFLRTRADIGLAIRRRVRVRVIEPGVDERRLQEKLAAYVARARIESRAPVDCELAMGVLLKRAASSAWAVGVSLRRRLGLLAHAANELSSWSWRQPTLPLGEWTEEERGRGERDEDEDVIAEADAGPWTVLGAVGFVDVEEERRWLTGLVELADAAAQDERKVAFLCRWLQRVREPVIVFTEYRDTLTHLAERLSVVTSCLVVHGAQTRDERRTALADFGAGRVRVLLATDAASEGLNLQASCRTVVNVELPWSPVRLEQRIGRVDRLGQTRGVQVRHLVLRGSEEERLLARLSGKVATIASDLGEAPRVLSNATSVRDSGAPGSAARDVDGDAVPDAASGAGRSDAADADTSISENGRGEADAAACVRGIGAPGSAASDVDVGTRPDADNGDGATADSVGADVDGGAAIPRLDYRVSAARAVRELEELRTWRRLAGLRNAGGADADGRGGGMQVWTRAGLDTAPLVCALRRARWRRVWRRGPGVLSVWRTRVMNQDEVLVACMVTPAFAPGIGLDADGWRAALLRPTRRRVVTSLAPVLRTLAKDERRWRRAAAQRSALVDEVLRRTRGVATAAPLLFDDIASDRVSDRHSRHWSPPSARSTSTEPAAASRAPRQPRAQRPLLSIACVPVLLLIFE